MPLSAAGRFARRAPYERAFVAQVLQLTQMGYDRLPPSRLAGAEETDITGELKRAIREAIEDQNSPDWVACYEVAEEVYLNTPGRLGKCRRRVDIEFVRVGRGLRPRFQFEAKRLHDSSSVSAYLGEDGLGCFFAGKDAYAAGHPQAGMLGYVQTETETAWADRIATRLMSTPSTLSVQRGTSWGTYPAARGPKYVFTTHHGRTGAGPIVIYHVFLLFC